LHLWPSTVSLPGPDWGGSLAFCFDGTDQFALQNQNTSEIILRASAQGLLLANILAALAKLRITKGQTKGMPMSTVDLESLVDAMTLAEQVSLLSGEDFWSLPVISRLGLGKIRVTDGPNGARGAGSLVGGVTAAAFPVGISIGASWDPALAEEIGAALAAEVKSKGAHVSLAPTVNIQRSVTNGRNFECYSEDPELTARLAVGMIRGLQGQGVGATIKHFVGNESEIERTTINSVVDERSLREVYLRPFEDAVKLAKTWGIMSSYNKLNGSYTAENHWLLTQVLRTDWGYDGIVMSDWYGSRSTAPTVNAGLDIEMPGPTRDRGDQLVAAVAAGEVSKQTVRTRALNVLRWIERAGALHNHAELVERADLRAEHSALIRRAGAAGTVLLSNDGSLPLAADVGRIAVIGPNAKVAQIMGGGSAQLNPHYAVSPWQALADRLGEDRLTYAPGCENHRWAPLLTGAFLVEYFDNRRLSGAVVYSETVTEALSFWIDPVAKGLVSATDFSARLTGKFTPGQSGMFTAGLFSAGLSRLYIDGVLVCDASTNWTRGRTFFEEGCDEVEGQIALEAGRDYAVTIEFVTHQHSNLIVYGLRAGISLPLGAADIAAAAEAARQADVALVFVGRSGEWDTEGSDLLGITLPGAQDALVSAVCAANPRTIVILQTGGPVEMPWLGEAAAILQAWYPGQEVGNAIADVLFGDAEPGGRLAQTFPLRWQDNPTWSQDPEIYPGLDGQVRYEEGVFVGYRHYEKNGIVPMFPFGHGLSYTTFSIQDLQATRLGTSVQVSMTVMNTGSRRGSTVVQVYVAPPHGRADRPLRELKGFHKLSLDAGAEQVVSIDLGPRAFAWFDVDAQCWQVDAGEVTVSAGFSAGENCLETRVLLEQSSLAV
jgi:beta-glucosidase